MINVLGFLQDSKPILQNHIWSLLRESEYTWWRKIHGSTLSIRRLCVDWRNMLMLIMSGIKLIKFFWMTQLCELISLSWEIKGKIFFSFNNWVKGCSRCRSLCSTLVDTIIDVFKISDEWPGQDKQFEVENAETELNGSCLKKSTLSWLWKGSRYTCFFNYICFRKFNFIPYKGVHTWQKGWRKMEVRTDLGNLIQPTKKDLVHCWRLAL